MKFLVPFIATLAVSAGAFAADNQGDCYQSVEAIDMALESTPFDQAVTEQILAETNKAVEACESQNMQKAAIHLKKATELFNEARIAMGPGIKQEEFWAQVRTWWGSIASPDSVTTLRSPINCDARIDMLGYRVSQESPEGATFDVLVAAEEEIDGFTQTGFVSLPYDNDSQFSLCHHGGDAYDTPEVTVETISMEGTCDRAIVIDDGMCDKVRLYWPKSNPGDDEVTLIIDRN
ncbi:MAG: hypothetical protein CMM94_06500 [Rickettsiales bacterium]|mgnify:CR=1 FL=1|nr:hypothetical protein [Rickettsiales bacterium]|tara:strand:+ start:84 stop:785 length:702 start_codon:yes stop_codon:yes gene_type:complete